MTTSLTCCEIRESIGAANLKRPAMSPVVRAQLGTAARVIDDVGLPAVFADWFQCTDTIEPFTNAHGKTYWVGTDEKRITHAVAIGRSEFGTHVVDCDTGCVVYVDASGETQLINTSVERFLLFIAHFNRASNEGFEDCEALRTAFEQIDRMALCNPEGIWSATLESAEAGLF